jgi:hypothetical protein
MDMSVIYRKSLKGIDELAFKTSGLPMRLMSYLMAVDGESSADQLAARNPQLPSLQVVLEGLLQQGFLEAAGNDANVVQMNTMRVGNGAPMQMPSQQAPTYAPASMQQQPMQQQPMQQQPMQQQPMQQQSGSYSPELEIVKGNMVKDVSAILGSDAAPVIQKIQGCRTKDDLFAAMMGIKKIISIYTNSVAAEKFAARYQSLI